MRHLLAAHNSAITSLHTTGRKNLARITISLSCQVLHSHLWEVNCTQTGIPLAKLFRLPTPAASSSFFHDSTSGFLPSCLTVTNPNRLYKKSKLKNGMWIQKKTSCFGRLLTFLFATVYSKEQRK